MYLIIGCRSVIWRDLYHLSRTLENEVQKLVSAAAQFGLSHLDAVLALPWIRQCTCKVVMELGWERRVA